MIRKPKRNMTRPQAPHGRHWESRWRSMWAGQRIAEKGLRGVDAWNETFKAMYGSDLPPGSPSRPPPANPLLQLLTRSP